MASDARTVSTAAHPTPHLDFTWLIFPAQVPYERGHVMTTAG